MQRPDEPAAPREAFLARVREWVEQGIPFNRVLGVQVRSIEHGRARLAVPFREDLIGDTARRALHGGVISALVDLAGGIAVWTTLGDADRLSTIDLRVDYLEPGPERTIVAEAVVIRTGNRVGVADVRVTPEDGGPAIALGKGVYSIRRGALR